MNLHCFSMELAVIHHLVADIVGGGGGGEGNCLVILTVLLSRSNKFD